MQTGDAGAGGSKEKAVVTHGVQTLWGDLARARWGPLVCELGIFWQNEEPKQFLCWTSCRLGCRGL